MSTAALSGSGFPFGPLRIHIDQPHLHGAERVFKLTVAGVALIAQPGGLGPPVDVLLRLPHILASAGEAEGFQAHRFQCDIAGQDHEVRPGDLAAVFLLDRPEQPARLVEVAVVRPAVQRGEPLRAAAGAAAAVADAIGAGAVPCHADEQRPVMAVVGRPPVLRIGHQRGQVLPHRVQVEAPERRGIVEVRVHRVDLRPVLLQHLQVQLVRPPVLVGRAAAHGVLMRPAHHRAFADFVHGCSFPPCRFGGRVALHASDVPINYLLQFDRDPR